MDFCEELQKPSIQCQLAKPNKLLYRSVYHYKLNVIQKDWLKVEKQLYLNDRELHFCTSFDFVPKSEIPLKTDYI